MTQYIVTSPEGKKYRINAPEGATQEQALDYAKQKFSQKPAEPAKTTGENLKRQVGLTGRYLAEGPAEFVGIFADPIGAVISKATGQRYQPLGEYVSQRLDDAGLPKPETPVERVVGDASRAVSGNAASMGAGGLASRVPGIVGEAGKAISSYRGGQIASATGAGAASGTSREMGGGPAVQFGAGIVGGAAPMSVDFPARMLPLAVRGVDALVAPFTASGRESIVGNTLRRFALNPDDATRNMNQAGEIVPGSRPTTAQAARDPGLANLERGLRNNPERGPRIGARLGEQNDARAAVIDDIAKDKDAVSSAKDFRDREALPYLEQAKQRGAKVDASPVLQTIDGVLAGEGGKRAVVRNALTKARAALHNQDGNLETDVSLLYGVRKEINDMISGRGDDATSQYAKMELKAVRDALDAQITKVAPEFGKYLMTYRALSKPIDQMTAAQEFRKNVQNAEQTASGTPIISQAKFFRQFTQDRAGLSNTLTTPQMLALERVAKDLDRGLISTTGGKAVGSPTIQNASTAYVLGRSLGDNAANNPLANTLLRPIGWMYKIPSQHVEELLYDAMLDPKLASALMNKPNAKSVQFLGRELKARYAAMTAGGVSGGLSAGQ